MIYIETIPTDMQFPFQIKDKDGLLIALDSIELDYVHAYIKNETNEVIRTYDLASTSSGTDTYQLQQIDSNTAGIWVTKEDLQTISEGGYVYVVVDIGIADENIPVDGILDGQEIIARIKVSYD